MFRLVHTHKREAGRGVTQTNMMTPDKPFQRVRHWSLLHTLGTAKGGGQMKILHIVSKVLGIKGFGFI